MGHSQLRHHVSPRDHRDTYPHALFCVRHYIQTIASRAASRRVATAVASRFTNRRFLFALAIVSLLGAKVVHIHAHVPSLARGYLPKWGYSFFAQDLALLLTIRLLLDNWVLFVVRPVQMLVTLAADTLLSLVIVVGVVNVSFYIVSGSEVHWRNIALATDSSSWSMFISGLFSLAMVVSVAFIFGCFMQDALFALFGLGCDLIKWPAVVVLRGSPGLKNRFLQSPGYDSIPQKDLEHGEKRHWDVSNSANNQKQASSWGRRLTLILISVALIAQIILSVLRPHESSIIFMSWTCALLPFVEMSNSSPHLATLTPVYGSGIGPDWDRLTAVHNGSYPADLPWSVTQAPGFWQQWVFEKHYTAANDPLKISNQESDLVRELRGKLAGVPIRHVVLLILESTRKDIFPLKKGGLIWETLASSFENGTIPTDAQRKLASLTPSANYVTGDYNDGFRLLTQKPKRRGGINFNNAYTSATYTLKSLVGTLCGTSPLVADFNLEVAHKLPAPCLPHILNAMNHMNSSQYDVDSASFQSDKWQASFMQSATMGFDRQAELLKKMGYSRSRLISKEYLTGEKGHVPKFGPVDLRDVNYFGIQESPLEDYIKDAFVSAKKKNERVFLTHLTSTSHHPFGLPESETYVPVADGMVDLSRYVNSIGYDDKWLGKILGILDEQGVADETLVVMVGDHGLSMPENGKVSSYYNANVGNFHVPLVLSHPKLPVMDIDDPVTSLQILPTILDLLNETGSLAPAHARFASDLAAQSYEGQTLIREPRKESKSGQGDWQFTVLNPGRAMVSVRDARRPQFRLIVPIISNMEWRFTDLSFDPTEEDPIQGFEFVSFLRDVELAHDIDAARWAEEAAFITRWWIEDNSKRWHFGRYKETLR